MSGSSSSATAVGFELGLLWVLALAEATALARDPCLWPLAIAAAARRRPVAFGIFGCGFFGMFSVGKHEGGFLATSH